MVKPKKQLGQHFLTDKNTAERICDALKNEKNLKVVEIGPGKGVLTQFLENKWQDLYLVELDSEAEKYIKDNFNNLKDKIINKDILKINIPELSENGLAFISNLPYNVSAPVMFMVYDNRDLIDECVFMLQKEVARRISSEHGSKVYGILSVLIQTYYDVKYLFTVNEGAFFPKPKVKSGVIRLKRNHEKETPANPDFHKRIVKAAFNQRRKTLRNSLKSILLTLPEEASWLSKRPEQCSIRDFIEISNVLNEINNN